MKSLISFIDEGAEEKKLDKLRILVVSAANEKGDNKLFHTAKRITEEGKKLGYEVFVVDILGAFIAYEEGSYKVYNSNNDTGFDIDSYNTIAIVRGTVRLKDSYLDLLSQLEKIGVCMINSRETINICADKYRTYLKLQDYGLTQPKTALVPSVEHKNIAIEKIDTKFPIIMKTLAGSKGVGVLFVESERSYDSLVQLLYSQNPDVDLLIQEYIKTDKDIRVIVLGGLIIGSMERKVIEGDFRSNVSQGGKVSAYDLSDLEIEQCLLASKAVNGVWTAVDFIPSEDPKTKPPYFLEVNHSPGTAGIEEATGKNIVKEVIQHFENLEVVSIKPFGELVAKFDTGNARYSVFHAEDIEINGKKITFSHGDKTITTKLIGEYVSVTGGGDDKRPIVELEFEFAGSNYGKIKFGLNNRDNFNTEVLLNRKTMRMLNVMVNPSRKYVVTTKFSVDK
jgi:RimK family alpha-L-glutamate ligase